MGREVGMNVREVGVFLYGYLDNILHIYGYLWLSVVIYGYLWLSMVIYGYLWLTVRTIIHN